MLTSFWDENSKGLLNQECTILKMIFFGWYSYFVHCVLKVRPALKALKLKVYMSTLCKSLSENKNGSAGRYVLRSQALLSLFNALTIQKRKKSWTKGIFSSYFRYFHILYYSHPVLNMAGLWEWSVVVPVARTAWGGAWNIEAEPLTLP